MALSTNEAIEIRKAVQAAGVKTVVSHQHRYGQHYRKVAEIIESGALGRVHTVYGHSVGWMLHLPSPDTIAGIIHFANGVRGYVESGAGAPDLPEVDYWWRKNRVGAQGTHGFAEVLTGAGWRAVTKDAFQSGEGCMSYELDMPPYVEDMARWLDDEGQVHPCHGESAYKGFEIAMAVLRSVVPRGQIRLPLGSGSARDRGAREGASRRPRSSLHPGQPQGLPDRRA